MALATDANDLWLLSMGWEAARDDMLRAAEEIEQQALSRWYGSPVGHRNQQAPRNRSFGYMSLMLPHMITDSPTWEGMSDGTLLGETVAEGTAGSLTQIHSQTKLNNVLRPCAWDFNLCYAGAYVDSAPIRGAHITPKMRRSLRAPLGFSGMLNHAPSRYDVPAAPRVAALDRRRWGWDTLARTWPEVRGYFHDATVDVEWLRQQAALEPHKWNGSVIQKLVETTNWADLGYAGSQGNHGNEFELRRQIVIRQFWIPEDETIQGGPSEGERGVIRRIAQFASQNGGDGAVDIARPEYWRGHHDGPYVVRGQYQPSRSTFPMSRMLAAKDSTDMVNAMALASSRRMQRARRVYGVSGELGTSARRLQRAQDGSMVTINNLFDASGKPMIVPVDFGGIDAPDITMMQWAIADNDESLGLSAIQRGAVGSANSATEVAVASQSYESTLGYTVNEWQNFVGEIGDRAAHMLLMNRSFLIHLNGDSKGRLRELQAAQLVREGSIRQSEVGELLDRLKGETIVWQGGDAHGAGDDFDPTQLGVKVRPYSMGGRGMAELQAEELQYNAALFQLSQQQAATPWMDLTDQFRALGRAFNKPNTVRMIDHIRKEQMLNATTMQHMTGEVAGLDGSSYQPSQQQKTPQLKIDAKTSSTPMPQNGPAAAAQAQAQSSVMQPT